ncbi:MAG: CpsD/CapB family tyrosine-protein kinase [Bacteroidota bacterium]
MARAYDETELLRRLAEIPPKRPGSSLPAPPGKRISLGGIPDPPLDQTVVTVDRYACLGSNLFPGKISEAQLAVGVTSPNPREGRTVVASNLAAFFAVDTRDETVLVDLSFRRPRVHEVFGVPSSPGILESVRTRSVALSRTAIPGLWVLPLGFSDFGRMTFDRVLELRETIAALKRAFRFVVVDMPPVLQSDFPGMVSSQLEGYFVVVASGSTRITEVRDGVRILNLQKIIGFVMTGSGK